MVQEDDLQIKIDVKDYTVGDFVISIYNPVNNTLANINFGENDIELDIYDEVYHHEITTEGIKEALISLIDA